MPLNLTMGLGNKPTPRSLWSLYEAWSGSLRGFADSAYDTKSMKGGVESMKIEVDMPVNPRNGRGPKPCNVELYRRMRSAVELRSRGQSSS
jgi:hypothetical protein